MEKSAGTSRFSPAVASWLVALGFVGLLVLLFWPAPEEPSPPPPPVIARPPSELPKVGLPDDPDLEGLPGFFAVWADYAEWKDNKAIFAYRHPVSGEFSLFFEAMRTPEGFRFRPIADRRETQGLVLADDLAPSAAIRFLQPAAAVTVGRGEKAGSALRAPDVPPPPTADVLLPDARGLRQVPPDPPPK